MKKLNYKLLFRTIILANMISVFHVFANPQQIMEAELTMREAIERQELLEREAIEKAQLEQQAATSKTILPEKTEYLAIEPKNTEAVWGFDDERIIKLDTISQYNEKKVQLIEVESSSRGAVQLNNIWNGYVDNIQSFTVKDSVSGSIPTGLTLDENYYQVQAPLPSYQQPRAIPEQWGPL